MKKNWVQIVSLALNAVLLICLVILGGKVENLHAETMRRMDTINDDIELLWGAVSGIQGTEWEQSELIGDFCFVLDTVNAETKTLDGAVELTLRNQAEDTTVELLATMGGALWTFPMTERADGVFTAAVSLPVELNGELRFEADITSQGETERGDVTAYDSLAMLLPLSSHGCGYGTDYRDGVLEVSFYDAGVRKSYGAEVVDPVFRVLKNGVAVQEISAIVSEMADYGEPDITAYAPATENESFWVDCENGDVIEIHLLCRDNFGLSYEFSLGGWTLNGEDVTDLDFPDADSGTQIFWNN